MKMEELVAQFDAQHSYAGEKFLERYLPFVDRIMDWIFAGMYVIEKQFTDDPELDEHDGEAKREELVTLTNWMIDLIPLPPMVRRFLLPLFKTALPGLISAGIAFLNTLLGNDDVPTPEERKSIIDLVPSAEFEPDALLTTWIQQTADGLTKTAEADTA